MGAPLALVHGRDVPLQQLRWLRAGPLMAALDGVDLRYIRLGQVELVRRIYVALRDRNWNTIPGVVSGLELEERPDSFDVRFSVRHTSHDTDFSWQGTISGAPEGHISFTMDGRGERDLLYNRIGFCVLQPWRESAGRPFRGVTPDGPVSGTLPELVGPQRFENGVYVPLFPSVSRLEIDLAAGPVAVLEFEGDLFETEDQRNWSDASFKTYCTPLALGFPRELKQGQTLTQTVIVHAEGSEAEGPPASSRLEIGGPTGARVPAVGLGLAAAGPSEAEAALLGALAPAHLRAEVHLADPGWPELLSRALGACAACQGAALELALFLRLEDAAELDRLRAALAAATVARVLVVPEGAETVTPEETTPPEFVALVRERLALDGVPVAGGTDMYFCELNRTKPQVAEMDGVFWSVNPQVHAFDDVSLLETLEAQGEQVRAAKAFAPGKQVFVGPVTLKRRYNVNATVAEEEVAGTLPDSVDPRQASLLGAAWTIASAKHLAEEGADAVTYFETTGWRGVAQGDGPPPLPAEFPARAGEAFPLYHAVADVCALRGAAVLACTSGRPLAFAGLAASHDGGMTVLVANLSPKTQTVQLAGLGGAATVRRLNEETAEQARLEPARFRDATEPLSPGGMIELAPYETVRIDSKGATT